jgi:hypothetical protein
VAALLLLSTAALGFVHLREKPPLALPMRFEVFSAAQDHTQHVRALAGWSKIGFERAQPGRPQ